MELRWRRSPLAAFLVLAVAAIFALAACGGDDEEPTPAEPGPAEVEAVRIAYFLCSRGNTYCEATLKGVRDAAAELGDATVTAIDGMFDANEQLRQVQDALTAGNFDAFVITAIDGNVLVPAIEEAIAAGIPVGCTLIPCGPDLSSFDVQVEGQTIYVGTSFPNNGRAIGQAVVEACEGKDPCRVAYLPGLLNAPFEIARLEGFKEVVEAAGNIRIVATQEGGYLAEPALTATQNILQANPNVDVIASSGDQMIVGAEQAVIDAGLEGQVTLVGNGASDIAKEAITAGRWFASAVYLPYTEGKVAGEAVIRAARGQDTGHPTGVNTDDLSPIGTALTPENADEFTPEWPG